MKQSGGPLFAMHTVDSIDYDNCLYGPDFLKSLQK